MADAVTTHVTEERAHEEKSTAEIVFSGTMAEGIAAGAAAQVKPTPEQQKTINEVKEFCNPHISLLGFLFTMSDPTINTKTSLKILRQTYPENVLRTVIPRNTDIRDAHFQKQDIFSFSPQSKSAQAYAQLIKELFYEKNT